MTIITNVRKFGEAGPFRPIETEDAEECACCEAARGVAWDGAGVIFLEVEGGPIRRVENLGVEQPLALFCNEVSADDARAELAQQECTDLVQQCVDLGLPPNMGEIMEAVITERVRELSQVLARMVELMGNPPKGERVTFGGALAQASGELGITVRTGSEDESLLLRTAFQIISGGRIPGAPDA